MKYSTSKNLKPLAALAASALSLNTFAASDMFLKLEGIDGESTHPSHEKEVDVLAWSWGMSQSGTLSDPIGGGAGKASFNDVVITKWADKSSVPLVRLVSTGDHINEAKLTVRRAGEKSSIFEELQMFKVLVTSSASGGSGGEDRLTENITLNFEAFCITYTEQRSDGTTGDRPQLCFNIPENQTCSVAQTDMLYTLPMVLSLPRHIRAELTPVCSTT
jgi:type VI secretion system secreted protein Hcp